MKKAVIQLGRRGDILNVLPLLEEANRNGKRAGLMVAREFADLLDGVSYLDPLVFPGRHTDVPGALRLCRQAGYTPVVAQLYGDTVQQERVCDSFCREAWRRCGMEHRWDQISLVLDRRDEAREQALADSLGVDWSRPVVLHCGAGVSSPFPDFTSRMQAVQEMLGGSAQFVDLSAQQGGKFVIRPEKSFDLLGLLDRATALVTIDTMPLHLARASAVPVLAFRNNAAWLGSTRFANHALHRTYKEFDEPEVAQVLSELIDAASMPRRSRRVVHLYPFWDMPADDTNRHRDAELTWFDETPAWVRVPFYNAQHRDSRGVLGDSAPVPFVKDLLRQGLEKTKRADDIVVVTNTDIGFAQGLRRALERNVTALGSAFAYRFNHASAPGLCSNVTNTRGYWDGGLDLFAFRRDWLQRHLDSLPDMVMGRTHWDLVYRHIVKQTGGADLTGFIWHVRHGSYWTKNPDSAGNRHNLQLSEQFFRRNDPTRAYRWTFREGKIYA